MATGTEDSPTLPAADLANTDILMRSSKLPETPAFLDVAADSPISEFALRVVVERPGWQFHVIGTASLVCTPLAITARHVLDHIVREYGAATKANNIHEISGYEVKLYQVLPGPTYRIWRVCAAWPCGTDIAVLHLGLAGETELAKNHQGKQPVIRAIPPRLGEKVVAFGYRESRISVTPGDDGTHHIDLNDRPTNSIGTVTQLYPSGRDRVMLPFPCFEIEARFDAGMSGGLVIDECGRLCGLISAGLQHESPDLPPIGYAASLWPMFGTLISAARKGRGLQAASYPVIELARDGFISVADLQELEAHLAAASAAMKTIS